MAEMRVTHVLVSPVPFVPEGMDTDRTKTSRVVGGFEAYSASFRGSRFEPEVSHLPQLAKCHSSRRSSTLAPLFGGIC